MTPLNRTLTVGNDTFCWNDDMEAFTWCPSEKEKTLVPVGKSSGILEGRTTNFEASLEHPLPPSQRQI